MPNFAFVNDIVASGTNLFAGTSYDGVFLSTDNGDNWIDVNSGLTNTDVNAMAVSGTNIYVGTYNGGVFLSTDNGSNWAEVNNGLTGQYLNVLSFASSGSAVFAGTNDGIAFTNDNGANWTEISTGLTNRRIVSLEVSGTNLIAGTWGSGVWSRPLSEIITSITTHELANGSQLLQNYPNPFTQTTTLKFEMSTSAFVNLSVFDVLGSEVAILMNEQLTAGTHEVIWDGTDYPGGIYFYKLSSENKDETMKMILSK
jgi:hypothetical protein